MPYSLAFNVKMRRANKSDKRLHTNNVPAHTKGHKGSGKRVRTTKENNMQNKGSGNNIHL